MNFTKEFKIEDWEKIVGGYKVFIPLEEYNINEPQTEIMGYENGGYIETVNSSLSTAIVTKIGTTVVSPNGPFEGVITIK